MLRFCGSDYCCQLSFSYHYCHLSLYSGTQKFSQSGTNTVQNIPNILAISYKTGVVFAIVSSLGETLTSTQDAELVETYNAHSMDQNNDSLESNQVITVNKNEKKRVARRRWAILAKALKSPVRSEPSSPTDEFSLRRISSFMLLRTQQLPSVPIDLDRKRTWYKYSTRIDNYEFFVKIGHRNRTFSAEDLMGFNNTGNVCIWPSEETLSYYVCANLSLFAGKRVAELGGGMSCLAGLFAAKYANAQSVTVTDGNKQSVENVQAALFCNDFECPISCKVLKWGAVHDEQYDAILCADCLFFDDTRTDLVECLWSCMLPQGFALIMAPERGDTLDRFVAQSEARGFVCNKVLNYNRVVWEKRLSLLDNCEYDDNIHYPILIEVTKL